jgi:hypothetical protein
MEFVIDRSMWFRGHGEEASRLMFDYGSGCCIGHVGLQCGVAFQPMLDVPGIADVDDIYKNLFPKWMRFRDGDIVEAYIINDNMSLTDNERETKLIALFAEHGDVLRFVN